MSQSGCHAVVFEAAGGVEALVLQKQIPGRETELSTDRIVFLQNCLAFANGQTVFQIGKRQQFMKSPNAAVPLWHISLTPKMLELLQAGRRLKLVPVVIDVQQATAFRASRQGFADVELAGAGRGNALLKSVWGEFFWRRCHRYERLSQSWNWSLERAAVFGPYLIGI